AVERGSLAVDQCPNRRGSWHKGDLGTTGCTAVVEDVERAGTTDGDENTRKPAGTALDDGVGRDTRRDCLRGASADVDIGYSTIALLRVEVARCYIQDNVDRHDAARRGNTARARSRDAEYVPGG